MLTGICLESTMTNPVLMTSFISLNISEKPSLIVSYDSCPLTAATLWLPPAHRKLGILEYITHDPQHTQIQGHYQNQGHY